MAKQFSLVSDMKLVQALPPAADAAGRTGPYVSLKGAHKAAVLVNVTQGNAATVALSLVQAKDLAGTGAKAIPLVATSINEDTTASDTLLPMAAAANYVTGVGVKPKMVVFKLTPEADLDLANGYSCIALVTGASNAANITEGTFVLGPLRYHQDVPPSAQA